MDRRRLIAICIVLLALSAMVRVLVWQNNKVAMAGVQYVVTDTYINDAKTLVNGDLRTFLAGPDPPSNANILGHPPGYPLFIAAVYSIVGESEILRIIQILLTSLASIFVFLIALELFNYRTGIIAGLLVAVSPQFAYHSGIVLPDELSVVPILIAVYALARGVKRPSIAMAVLCGVALAISCWLRSNALLLPLFFAVTALLLLPKKGRLRFAVFILAAFIIAIAPITIRNALVFRSFIPLSLGMGTTFIEGLGDLDTDKRLGLPVTDEDVMSLDALRDNRPDYYGMLYSPDGARRDRERTKFGLSVIGQNPGWYLTGVARRGLMGFRLERVPAIAPERDERETTGALFYLANMPLKLLQGVFITAVFLPLWLAGIVIVLRDRATRASLVVLVTVPVYFAVVQSLIHTEYRYLLATPHVLMIVGAVTISFVLDFVKRALTNRSNRDSLAGSQ